MKYLSLFLVVCCFLGCKDDDDGSANNLPDLRCADGETLRANCSEVTDLSDEAAFKAKLIGSWEIVASDPTPENPDDGGCLDVAVDERIRFTFEEDGTFTVTEPNLPTETGTYQVNMICGFVPPCEFFIVYEGITGFRPGFNAFCGTDGAYSDARAFDGPYYFYQKF